MTHLNIYYHITPAKNVSRIMTVGLLPAKKEKLGLSAMVSAESTVARIYVTDNLLAARDLVPTDFMEKSAIRKWTVLEVRTSEVGRLDSEFGGFAGVYYLARPVLPSGLRIVAGYFEEEGVLTF